MAASFLLWLSAASWAYWLATVLLARRFFGGAAFVSRKKPPAVSVLKPVKGVEAEAFETFASFCRQDHPQFELLFGVADAQDPAAEVVERLRLAFPHVSIRLVVAPQRGENEKAGLLAALAAQARHDVLVASDADMRVPPDYLRRVGAALGRKDVGLVTCPYVGASPGSLWARLEALHMGTVFLPSVLAGRQVLRMRFALGATVALRKETLERIGGFAALTGHLADDYQLGARVHALGLRVELSACVLRSVLGPVRLGDGGDREVRWARCTRVSHPPGYFGYALTFSTPLSLLALAASGGSAAAWGVLGGSFFVRWGAALLLSRQTGDEASRQSLWLLPVRDVLTAAVWAAGAVGRQVTWRGRTYRLLEGGRMRRCSPAPARRPLLPGLSRSSPR